MITLELTNSQAQEVLYATSLLYQEYTNLSAEYDESIRRYNNTVDELRQTIKDQLKEQDIHEN
jgi:hypothetical protein